MSSKQTYSVCFCCQRRFKLTVSEAPAEIRSLYQKYSDENGIMTASHLRSFLVEVQREEKVTEEETQAIIDGHKHLSIFHRRGLNLESFLKYLFGDYNPPLLPSLRVHQDMSSPLSHYFIYTGHNSYLTGNQLSSDCSDLPIIIALQRGVRVIELDTWPNASKDDVDVLHGNTLTTPVALIKCLRSIKDYAFVASEYPVVITLEDHLTPDLHAKVAEMVKQTFGDILFCPGSEPVKEFPSPDSLKKRIIISTKPPKEYLEAKEVKEKEEGSRKGKPSDDEEAWGKEVPSLRGGTISDYKQISEDDEDDLNDEEDLDEPEKSRQNVSSEYRRLIAIHAGKPKGGLEECLKVDPDKVRRLSLSELQLEKAAETYGKEIVRFTQRNILRVYPKGTRITSTNYNPLIGWMHGAQMVAFNMQGYGRSLWLMHGMFQANGRCGYVKKPDFLLKTGPHNEVFDPKAQLPVKTTLKVTIYMGEGWYHDFKHTHFDQFSPPDFYTRVGIAGVPSDTVMKKTKSIEDSWLPSWNEVFEFPLSVPELALLRIEVHEYDMSEKDDFGGQTCLPVWELRSGIRAVPLYSRKGDKYNNTEKVAEQRSAKMASAASPKPLSDSDSDEGSSTSLLLRHSDLSESIFKSYFNFTGHSSTTATAADLSKIRSFLASSSSGALSCLICLERIKPSDPTWSCTSLCFAVFHLFCIQSWARQASDLSAARASTRLPITPETASETSLWNCPKCRSEYPKSHIPKTYLCFCGKLENPPSDDPWVLPHSCGDICGRPLKNRCGHNCLLLCHPGPCPSCPQLVKAQCFCGSHEDVRRCGFKEFSCDRPCSKVLDCGVHSCVQICHRGTCPPCRTRGVYRCKCGKVEEERECCDRVFRCGSPCEKRLSCGKHVCEKGCHVSGECGECPLQGKRSCPCGKRVYEGMPCDAPLQVCGSTCDKMLPCGYHRCPERCHRGQCVETCRIVVRKSCRCGSLKKDVPCYQDLACERKCQRMRDCGRHACKRRCCDGDCPPCSETCGRRLRCKNHKCPSPCHRGPCAPCPIMVTITCACGETHFEVPCGTEMDQKPPKCRKPCPIKPLCRHSLNCKPHKCHYGACPPCRLPCAEEYQCGHTCKLRCHGAKPPPNPEFTLKPKKKKVIQQSESVPGTPCPPCPELVWRSCVGQHIGEERMMVCSDKSQFYCENLCGNPLPCGNHYCTKTCHALENQSPMNQLPRSEPCEDCSLRCQKEREPMCPHHCPRRCHRGDCPPCKVLIKRSCHCGAMVHVFECIYYNSLSAKSQETVRSCGGPCHRKLPNCTHLCPEICHPGQCPNPEKCCKKVTVRCKCQTLKKEWLCQDVQAAHNRSGCHPKDIPKNQFGIGLIPCNSDCKSKVQVVESELQLRKSRVTEVKEPDKEKSVPKRRKRRERVVESKEPTILQKIISRTKQLLLFVFILVILLAATYYGYKGLLRLNDWMNEVEEQRQRYSRTK